MTRRIARYRRRLAAAFVAVFGVALLVPAVVLAHARLTRSEPAAGAQLETSPAFVRLWFSERTEVALSRITIEDSAGRPVEMGAVERDSARLAIRAEVLGNLGPGHYTVSWRTAGVDGHPLQGTFGFVVRARSDSETPPVALDSAATRGDSSVVVQHVMDATSLPYVFVRALLIASLLAVVGSIVFLTVILPRVPEQNPYTIAAVRARACRLGAWAAWVLVVAVVARLLLQSIVVNGPRAFEHLPLVHLTLHTQWGRAWVAQFGAALLAYVALRGLMRGARAATWLALVAALGLAVTPALSGHAVALERLSWLAIGSDAVHVLAAAGWMGGLFCMMVAALPEFLRTRDDVGWRSAATMVNAFSPIALILGGVVVASGVVNALLELGGLGALWTSGYGRVLLIKLAFFVFLAGVASYNWRRVRPALGNETSTARLRDSARFELMVASVIVVVTAILVAMPTPASGG